ncbi:hypothetical protein GGR57DRAFT_442212 [Xylariaceae sp. FL1272]|nr:hypothetical protein GGR57DRAFT_442212 [Xylariaceae sp. FL1272]
MVQPLDVGVFGLLRKRLRKCLRGCLSSQLGGKPSKSDMLEALYHARVEIMNVRVITKAWKTAGIWPRDRQQALKSPYIILEEEGVARTRPEGPPTPPRPQTPNFAAIATPIAVKTLGGGQDRLRSSRKVVLTCGLPPNPAQRLLDREASKALDQKAAKIAESQAYITTLERKLVAKRLTKRRKVTVAPGQRFIHAADVRRVRRRMRNRVVYEDEDKDFDVPRERRDLTEISPEDVSEVESCIFVD